MLIGIAKETFDGNYDRFEPVRTANHDAVPSNLRDKAESSLLRVLDATAGDHRRTRRSSLRPTTRRPGTTWPIRSTRAASSSPTRRSPARPTLRSTRCTSCTGSTSCAAGANAVFTASSNFVPEAVARGEFAVGVTGESNIADLIAKGRPGEGDLPKEGTGARFDASGIIKNGPNPQNARLFMDFMTSKEAYEIIYQVDARRTVHPQVPAPGALPPLTEIPLVRLRRGESGEDPGGAHDGLRRLDPVAKERK